jgi:hypothetical protein
MSSCRSGPRQGENLLLYSGQIAQKSLPFYRMVTPEGPKESKGLTFSSLHHNFTSLAERDGFKDRLRVHGIRGGVANKVDRMSPCTVLIMLG